MADNQFYTLPVKSVVKETPEAVTVSFEIPEEHKQSFSYQPGQYLTLKFKLKGLEVRRAYSMCSSPIENELAVTVKQVDGGLVSTHINQNLKAGDMVESMLPEGRFLVESNPETNKTYYLIGAGSGITPLLSIIKTVLEKEPKSSIFLLYGNRNEDSIIFKQQLKQLEERYSGQLIVEHILSQPKKEKGKGLSGIFSKGKTNWQGKVGRIGASTINEFLTKNPKRSQQAEYYLCGPGGMIETAKRTLENKGIAKENIHVEYFTAADSNIATKTTGTEISVAGAKAKVHLNGDVVEVQIPEGKTILDALIKEGYDPPYSCTSGACSTCLAKTLSGSVKMDVYYAIDDEEVAEGFILTCQAHPTTSEIEVTFEV
ncbi:MAG: 2Fe-2S iron-sulfur cluster-binding protein [Bacteroidota bacterium]